MASSNGSVSAPAVGARQTGIVRDRAAEWLDHAPGQYDLAAPGSFPFLMVRIAPDQRNAGTFPAMRAFQRFRTASALPESEIMYCHS